MSENQVDWRCDPEEMDNAMVAVPEGSFQFGMTREQKEDAAKRCGVHPDMLHFHSNAHRLTTKQFWIDRYPVTRAQFLRFMRATDHRVPYNGWLVGWTDLADVWCTGDPRCLALPAIGVNCEDAQAYARWLGKRLPTEVEWEKAARGASGALFAWGDDWDGAPSWATEQNLPIGCTLPVGTSNVESPYGVSDMGVLVCEWVQSVFTPVSKDGTGADGNAFVLAGSAPIHLQPYTRMATNRMSWSQFMRVYTSGFRCVADYPPKNCVAEPRYRPPQVEPLAPVPMARELYLKERIRLEPTECSTFKVHVPWFPRSVWVVDIPEGNWGPFGGANEWPSKARELWEIDWEVMDSGRALRYRRTEGNRSLQVEVWSDGPAVRFRITPERIGTINIGSICVKTFSPFFSSQERLTQCRPEDGKLVRCCDMPIDPWSGSSFWWSIGQKLPYGAGVFRSFDGTAYFAYAGPKGCDAGGNSWPPCIHLRGNPVMTDKPYEGRLLYLIGPQEALFEELAKP